MCARSRRSLLGRGACLLLLLAAAGPLAAAGARQTPAQKAARLQLDARSLAIGYRLCVHAYPDFEARAAVAWAGFRKRYPAAAAAGMQQRGLEGLEDTNAPISDEEEQERLSACVDLLEPGGFDPTRTPDPRLASPTGSLELLETALRTGDRALARHALMGQARHRVALVMGIDDDATRALADSIHAVRLDAEASLQVDGPSGDVLRGRGSSQTLLIEYVRGEWRIAHL
jgi:hypothetical protein